MPPSVTLCVPPQGYFAERWQESSMPSLGVLYMAAVLRREGIPVQTLPAHILKLDIDGVVRHVLDEKPDIFGLTITTENRLEAFDVAREVKRARPETLVVVGGPHCLATAKDTLDHIPEIDIVVSGEGEETIVELVRAVEAGGGVENFKKVSGISFLDNGVFTTTGPRLKIPDLNTLPMPARDIEDMSLYNFKVDVPGKGLRPAANLMTSRGCPFDCNFCATPVNWGRKVRGVEPVKVIEEIEYCIDNYGAEVIWFYDDTLNYNPKRLSQICDMMIERKLNVNWFCEIRVDAIDRALFDKMVAAGMFHFGFGVESANERICRDIIHKKATLQQARDVIDWGNEAGIIANPFFIFSHPTETWEEALETLEFAESLKGRAMCSMAILHVYPSTELWDRAVSEKKIPDDFTWTAKDDPRIIELPEAQGNIPLYMDKLSWFQISTIIFRFSQSAMKVSLWGKVKKAVKRINSFRRFKQYFVMGLALVSLKVRKAFGGGKRGLESGNKYRLIDKLLNEAKWIGKDDFPSSIAWKDYIEEALEYIDSKGKLSRFWPRLTSSKQDQRKETLAELYAAMFVEKQIGFDVIEWDVETVNNKDVDFVALESSGHKIYCEVKNPGWKGELDRSSEEKTRIANERSKKEKDIHAEAYSYSTVPEIREIIKRAYDKFMPNKNNLLIVIPDLRVSPLEFSQNIDTALYSEITGYGDEKGSFANAEYENIGGILFVEPMLRGGDSVSVNSGFYQNKNATKPLDIII